MKVDAVCACGVLPLAVIGCSEGDDHCDAARAGILHAIARTGINGLHTEPDTTHTHISTARMPLVIRKDARTTSDGTGYCIDWLVGWHWQHELVLVSVVPGPQRRARRLYNTDGSALWGIRLDVGTYCIQCRKQFVLRGYRQPFHARSREPAAANAR